VRFAVLMAVNIKIMVFCDVRPCSLVVRHGHFEGIWCLHLLNVVKSQKTCIVHCAVFVCMYVLLCEMYVLLLVDVCLLVLTATGHKPNCN
jgi:hypothetical protein